VKKEQQEQLEYQKQGREEEERLLTIRLLSTAVEQAPSTVVVTDVDGTIQYVNPAFTEVTGYSKEEAIGLNPKVLKSGYHPQEFYEEMWRTILSGLTWKGRIYNRKKDGSLYCLYLGMGEKPSPSGEDFSRLAV